VDNDKNMKQQKEGLSRRNFMKGVVLGAGCIATGAFTGCGKNKEPAKTPEEAAKKSRQWMNKDAGIFDWRKKPSAPTNFAQSFSCDVVVCGAGISGLNAARSAAEQGLKVIVLENDATYDVHGYQCAAINSKIQRSVGAEIDPMEFFEEFNRIHGYRNNADILRLWVDNSGAAFDWFEQILPPAGSDPKTNYRSLLYWPRPENWKEDLKDEAFKEFVGTIDFTYGSWRHAGDILAKKCVELGCEFHYKTRGYMLIQDDSGRVTGIIARKGNTYEKYETKKGVILTTGTFAKCKEMVHEIDAEACLKALQHGKKILYSGLSPQNGDGHKMVVWAGGDIEPFTQFSLGAEVLFGPTPGMSINLLGKRYRNEDAPNWIRPITLCGQPKMFGWDIFDANWRDLLPLTSIGHRAFDIINNTPNTIPAKGKFQLADGTPTDGVARVEDLLEKEIMAGVGRKEGVKIGSYVKRPGRVFAANTLEELAQLIKLDGEAAANFIEEVKKYNEMCAAHKDTQFGKRANLMRPIVKPPFIACGAGADYGIQGYGYEGVQVNNKLEVIHADTHKPIGGLWCAGQIVGGRHALMYLTPMSGMNHGFAVTFGKLVGEFVAKA
jgi:hypothetical protein